MQPLVFVKYLFYNMDIKQEYKQGEMIMVHNAFVAKYYWYEEQGALLKKAIKNKKITYEDLAKSVGYNSRQYIGEIVRATTGVIDSSILEKICRELNVDISYFYPSIIIKQKSFF